MTEYYNKKIAQAAAKLIIAFRDKMEDKELKVRQQEDLVDSEEFTEFVWDELSTQTVELVRALVNADIFAGYYAGFNMTQSLMTPKEQEEDEIKRTKEAYKRLNHTLQHFTEEMDEIINNNWRVTHD